MNPSTLNLPLIPQEAPAEWEGFRLEGALAAPEPDAPQGEYAEAAPLVSVPLVGKPLDTQAELLAPAGGVDSAFAAFHFGADAIYLGLKKFSARAEAENFTLEEVSEVVAYAHTLSPRRRVFVAINTVIRNDELGELVEALAALESMGVDAVILQDLGVYHLIRRYFPRLELHASTQLAVHNHAGAEALRAMGFARVVLARELTLEEVRDITSTAGVETEVFIHGALCYSYSGLCLFSSQTLGRSGNRGKCAYSCRDSFEVEGAPLTLRDGTPTRRDPRTGFPFSMKDLALPDHVPALREAGVSCFKIEGRKKSPLYVATATDFYRKLIDGTLAAEERANQERDLQSAFGRPWTRLFVDSHKDKEVADRDLVGHRGALIGEVEAVVQQRGTRTIRFRSVRAIERFDGLQIDLPVLGKPFGFGIRRMWIHRGGSRELVVTAPPGVLVEVELPNDHREQPNIPMGALIYCASSNAVKRDYQHDRPKPGLHRARQPVSITLHLSESEMEATGRGPGEVEVRQVLAGPFTPARDLQAMEAAVRGAFEKLGDTSLRLERLEIHNSAGVFVPVSRLNALRRDLVQGLENALDAAQTQRVAQIVTEICPPLHNPAPTSFRWNLKVDRIEYLDVFTDDDFHDVDEVCIDIARDHPAILTDRVTQLAERLGHQRIRLALPALTRKWEERGIVQKLDRLRRAGFQRWEASNVSAWTYLGLDPSKTLPPEVDLATEWSIYAMNRVTGRMLRELGVSRFTLSPEDGLDNLRPMFAEFGPRAVLIVYQDTPLFMAESCAYANLIGGCPGKANCSFESMDMVSSHGEKVSAIDYHCRTIVLNQGPFCLSPRLKDIGRAGAVSLRADFVYRRYASEVVAERWRIVRAGKVLRGGHSANFDRGVL